MRLVEAGNFTEGNEVNEGMQDGACFLCPISVEPSASPFQSFVAFVTFCKARHPGWTMS